MKTAPVALTIAGSDSSAGAGVQADLKTFSALEVYGVCAVTCVVAETPGNVASIHALESGAVRSQVDVVLNSFPIGAAKTGLLHSAGVVGEVAECLQNFAARTGSRLPLVIDPVMVATSGALLLQRDAIARYVDELFPLAALLTPNLDEAAELLGDRIQTIGEMRAAGEKLREKYGVPLLLKGGHLAGDEAVDLLFDADGIHEFCAPFTRGVATHGTGCTYSAAITAGLASGLALPAAVARAKSYVTRAIERHLTWGEGSAVQLHALEHRA